MDFIDGPYWAKMFVLCFYTIWIVMPFKILILTSALASVNPMYYNAARVDGTSRFRMFTKITLPMISPMVFYLIITGFIGAFKAYSDAVALFGTNLNAAEMNTIVGYVYDQCPQTQKKVDDPIADIAADPGAFLDFFIIRCNIRHHKDLLSYT